MSAPFQFNTTEQDLPYILFYDSGDQVVPVHWHREIELAFTLKGSARLLVNDEMYEIKEDEAILINGGDSHFYFASKDHKRLVIIFSLDILEGTKSTLQLRKEIHSRLDANLKACALWKDEDKAQLKSIIKRLETINDQTFFARDLLIRSLVFEILFLFTKEEYKDDGKKESYQAENKAMTRLQKVFYYIEQNYMKDISLHEIASVAGFEPSYFTRFFKSYTKVTFYDYLTNYRISKARFLLVQKPDLSVGEVAESCGFNSIKTFNRSFLVVAS